MGFGCNSASLIAATMVVTGCATSGGDASRMERRVQTLEDQLYRLEREREALAARVAALEGGGATRAGGDAKPARSAPKRPETVPPRATPPPSGSAGRSGESHAAERQPVRAVPDTAGTNAGRTEAQASAPASAEAAFDRARDQYRQARFAAAVTALKDYLDRFPTHNQAEEAQFLLGESWYALGNFPQAVVDYGVVFETWPKGKRAPDSLHKVALSYYELDDERNALAHLERLAQSYPRSEAAEAGRPLLEKLRKRQRGR